MSHGRGAGEPAEVLLEFQRIGNAVKVTAIDPETLVEVSIVGDPAVGEETLKRTAIRKLRFVLDRRAKGPPPRPGRGHLV
jgi:hypothetical protein